MMKSLRTVMFVLAVMTLFSHMVIPHDHHMTGPVSGVNDNCPLSGEDTGHHPLFPYHCHAFNDLAVEKFTPVIRHYNSESFITFIKENDHFIPALSAAGPANLIYAEHSPVLHITDLSPFRAPPSAA